MYNWLINWNLFCNFIRSCDKNSKLKINEMQLFDLCIFFRHTLNDISNHPNKWNSKCFANICLRDELDQWNIGAKQVKKIEERGRKIPSAIPQPIGHPSLPLFLSFPRVLRYLWVHPTPLPFVVLDLWLLRERVLEREREREMVVEWSLYWVHSFPFFCTKSGERTRPPLTCANKWNNCIILKCQNTIQKRDKKAQMQILKSTLGTPLPIMTQWTNKINNVLLSLKYVDWFLTCRFTHLISWFVLMLLLSNHGKNIHFTALHFYKDQICCMDLL